jgi:hypothetical protein
LDNGLTRLRTIGLRGRAVDARRNCISDTEICLADAGDADAL